MERYPFIFSNRRSWKIRRHLSFWLCWWVFQSMLYSFSAFVMQISYLQRLPLSSVEALFFLLPHMFLAYSLMYWVIPNLLVKGKYLVTVLAVILLFLATALLSSLISIYILNHIRTAFLGTIFVPPPHINDVNVFIGLLAGLRGAITIGGLAAAIKLMKYWYGQGQRNLQLQKDNMEAELQLLKAQVHPHFLFNTLNNIYSYTQGSSPVASKLVLGLSDMLRYMLYECNQALVPLDKELKLLKDYILLEQIRYNRQLEVNLDLPTDTNNLHISPLLLLPFVENSFKHGTSEVLEHPWISLQITLECNKMKMKLINGKVDKQSQTGSAGIGISNVKKRLELLYPGKYNLKINNGEDVFIVNLKMELEYLKQERTFKFVQAPSHA